MKFVLVILILFGGWFHSIAQEVCPEFGDLMRQADSLFRQAHEYRKAFFKYNTARTCSPSRRQEVDDRINQLFEEMAAQRKKAEDNEMKAKKVSGELIAAKERERVMQLKDSIVFAEAFIRHNKKLVDTTLSSTERKTLLDHADHLRLIGQGAMSNSVGSSLTLLLEARRHGKDFLHYFQQNLQTTSDPKFFEKNVSPIDDIGYVAYDTYYYWALTKTDQAMHLLPDASKYMYGQDIEMTLSALKTQRKLLEQNYWMPDTVIDLPMARQRLFALASADYQNYDWASVGVYEEFKRLPLRFLNLSVNDLSFSTDSLFELTAKGSYNSVLATDGNYRYMVVKQVNYSLKKNLVDFASNPDTSREQIKLIDKNGNVLTELYPGDFFFSPDAKFLSYWTNGSDELHLFDLKTKTNWKFSASQPVHTMSFSLDSKNMLYYNDSTRTFYALDITGSEPHISSYFAPPVNGITNIDYTGNNKFLKINTLDSVFLYDLDLKKVVFRFDSSFVRNIVVAPNGKEALLTCNRVFGSDRGYFTYCVNMDLTIKDKLYSDCNNFFYTPDGRFIVGYDNYDVMRWSVDKSAHGRGDFETCLGFDELIEKKCVPFSYFLTTNDAIQLERGARKLYDIGSATSDTLLRNLYYRQSQLLFDRLKIGDVQNFRNERLPFFYDWSAHIRRLLGNRDFYDQFTTQQIAVEIWERLVNSPDGKYPMLLSYAANGNMFLNNLYDSLKIFSPNYLGQLKKEIGIRERVFEKDPDNTDNFYYTLQAFRRFSTVIDTLGWRYLKDRKYADRLDLLRQGEQYLALKLNSLPDSFEIKTSYIEALAQLAPSYLYTFASSNGKDIAALDSAIYFADKGIALTSEKFKIATFNIVKARAFLLQENGIDKALDLYRKVLNEYPDFGKATMLSQLTMMKEAGANASVISRAEEFLNKN